MKANKYVKKCGPFVVTSISQDGYGVRLQVYPAFPDYDIKPDKDCDPSWQKDGHWVAHRLKGEGGGPSIFNCIALAQAMEGFLNQCYSQEQVDDWKRRLEVAMAPINTKINKALERAMKRQARVIE